MKIIDKNLSILEHEFSDEFENSQRNKYLVLNLRGEEFAIEISYITEIIEKVKTIFVPGETAGTKFFIEHKNKFIPAVSLRKIFNLSENESKDKTSIIININETQNALIVDSVLDIEDIDIENSEKTETDARRSGAGFIKMACRVNGAVKNILNMEKIFFN